MSDDNNWTATRYMRNLHADLMEFRINSFKFSSTEISAKVFVEYVDNLIAKYKNDRFAEYQIERVGSSVLNVVKKNKV